MCDALTDKLSHNSVTGISIMSRLACRNGTRGTGGGKMGMYRETKRRHNVQNCCSCEMRPVSMYVHGPDQVNEMHGM